MRVLAVGAHPDDVELGAGATLAKHVAAGDQVTILVMTEGAMSRAGATTADREMLIAQAEKAARSIGATFHARVFPDQRLDSVGALELAKSVEYMVGVVRPEVVYTHYGGDLNRDHRETFEAVAVACRPVKGSPVRALYCFEVPSSTEWAGRGATGFRPNMFSELSDAHLKAKLDALACYIGEMRESPHPRSDGSLRALARWRGSCAGVAAAEAFELVRELR